MMSFNETITLAAGLQAALNMVVVVGERRVEDVSENSFGCSVTQVCIIIESTWLATLFIGQLPPVNPGSQSVPVPKHA
jgi:hypothetical protein